MEREGTPDQQVETTMDGRIQELIRKYDPGLFFEEWLNEFKGNFKKFKWGTETEPYLAMIDGLFWVECLLQTWREEIGLPDGPKGLPRSLSDLVNLETITY